MPLYFRVVILIIAAVNFVFTFYYERVIVISLLQTLKEKRVFKGKKAPKKPYKWLKLFE